MINNKKNAAARQAAEKARQYPDVTAPARRAILYQQRRVCRPTHGLPADAADPDHYKEANLL